jgi:hypothetical protein
MEIHLAFKYQGAQIEGSAYAEENYNGWTYEVQLDQLNTFRIYFADNEEWKLLRGDNGTSPVIEEDLLKKVIDHIMKSKKAA